MKPNCWWCCHPFEWDSLHFPYALKNDTFYTTGHFCSWGCMKAYAIDKNKLGECEYITLMRKKVEGKITPVRRAPSRYCLELFGGTVNIESFRSGTPRVFVKIPGEFYQHHETIKEDRPISSSSSSTPGLKLKREKPLERAKGKLETSLGIIRKCSVAADREKNSPNKEKV